MRIGNAINKLSFNNVNTVIFNSNGTYTVPANIIGVFVEMVGGGGPGRGGITTVSPNRARAGGSGTSGGYVLAYFSKNDLPSTVAITIGSGGSATAGGTANPPGSDGGNTLFGALCTALGGVRSGALTAGDPDEWRVGNANVEAHTGGTGTFLYSCRGRSGQGALARNTGSSTTRIQFAGKPTVSMLAKGSQQARPGGQADGLPGTAPGGGGGGAVGANTVAFAAGGDGAPGQVRIYELVGRLS